MRLGLDAIGILNLVDLMDIDKDALDTIRFDLTPGTGSATLIALTKLDIIKVLRLQQWYSAQDNPTAVTWSSLNKT
jgi:hypothetical protein